MSLNGALQIGRSGLLASQAAIQVTGNNIANVAVAGYHRQTVNLQPARDQQLQQGIFLGRGVQLQSIVRQINQGLESRLRDSQSGEAGALARHDILMQIEAIQNELTDHDLSSQLAAFFNAWSELGNRPTDNSLRTLVIEQGSVLASHLADMQQGLSQLRDSVDASIRQDAGAANDLLTQIAEVNRRIVVGEGGTGQAHALRDQRDSLLGQLSQYMDISVNEQPNGSIDVYVGSLPVVLGNKSRGVEIRTSADGDQLRIELVLSADGSVLSPQSGKLGALIQARQEDVLDTLAVLDGFAHQLINEVNRVHSQGQGMHGFSSITSTARLADANVALNDPATGLHFTPGHGSFNIYVTQKSTGQRVESGVSVDLDGIGSDMTLADLANAISGVPNITATVTPDNRIAIAVNGSDFEITFGQDSSGVLAALGINTFFTGHNAATIGVNDLVRSDPAALAASRTGSAGDNTGALAMAKLAQQVTGSDTLSLPQRWEQHVQNLAIRIGQSRQSLDAASLVRGNLAMQQQSYSGVNIDEETINLLAYQRAYQGSARFLGVVDEMMQTLLQLI